MNIGFLSIGVGIILMFISFVGIIDEVCRK